ncbi:aldolase/citrate lyase family protein [Rhodoplanes sp. TEM]|uniref:Aldolase/citrate lyase family protein n=1 Tax=Rhodoplanes tepidamans TaxID=200616 RepID=A0ABT5JJ19_RHOTP|nr:MULTISPECIES: aldolase/citrate lyase family protein [Rhodoplanes]MDC7789715.1 aldolase/citrate lyase family protein [Rhodoplanes tepidamans]MDC7985864.1 aldolase/citrate lyase family protein [Rhodoplanes sp. TEM]MDQ0354392.1 2-keto-3-deoxy-L-rhamnonate aldolase RhmA [Rhodoplanes tepidamans]
MTIPPAPDGSFRARLAAGQHLVGTFVKTPTMHATEILGALGFDFVVIDEEHAPFDRAAIDVALLAAKAAGLAGLVRVASSAPSSLLSVLDMGATGMLVPHVSSAAMAREVAAACRYRGGRRGYSGSPRSAGYGAGKMWSTIDACDAAVTVIAQIEDPEALDEIDAIAAVEGIDALFIGRGDLTCAMGAAKNDAPEVRDAVDRIAAAAKAAGKPVAVFVGGLPEATWLKERGASAFVVSSDQGFLRNAAAKALAEIGGLGKPAA